MKKTSLQDQLLKVGLTSKTKAHKVNSAKRKKILQKQKNKIELIDEVGLLVKEAKAKQLQKDKLLNEQRNQAAEKKQIAAQIVQLINLNKLPQDTEGVAYNFTDNKKVKALYVSEALRTNLVAGTAVVVKLGKTYEAVPAAVAEKIAQRDKGRVIYSQEAKPLSNDDTSADFVVPDDLMW